VDQMATPCDQLIPSNDSKPRPIPFLHSFARRTRE
jgi:hypothetical protein